LLQFLGFDCVAAQSVSESFRLCAELTGCLFEFLTALAVGVEMESPLLAIVVYKHDDPILGSRTEVSAILQRGRSRLSSDSRSHIEHRVVDEHGGQTTRRT
jgi:hypothetical protein